MKAYRIAGYTGPSGLELVEEPDLPPPVGRSVNIRLRASSINFCELLDIRGELAARVPLLERRIPGSDGTGEVIAVGPDVSRVQVGDRVALTFHPRWIAGAVPPRLNILGRGAEGNDGTLVQQSCVDESELVHIPDCLSFEEAAMLPCAGVTAWCSLLGPAKLIPGETLLV